MRPVRCCRSCDRRSSDRHRTAGARTYSSTPRRGRVPAGCRPAPKPTLRRLSHRTRRTTPGPRSPKRHGRLRRSSARCNANRDTGRNARSAACDVAHAVDTVIGPEVAQCSPNNWAQTSRICARWARRYSSYRQAATFGSILRISKGRSARLSSACAENVDRSLPGVATAHRTWPALTWISRIDPS